ncbi:hypothetical protein T11_9827 [Trichinella zimbabwensis]|uniref:Uncharacterized protein n=1 Tax=Trichinella zimbabwensis TaxID=268475 RepID=A0A0V1H8D7_9BILA|nr:hypothetical protein T11_9827 [Trichinella zimbabwensis]
MYPVSDGVIPTMKLRTFRRTYNPPVRKLRLLEPVVDIDGIRPSRGKNVRERVVEIGSIETSVLYYCIVYVYKSKRIHLRTCTDLTRSTNSSP